MRLLHIRNVTSADPAGAALDADAAGTTSAPRRAARVRACVLAGITIANLAVVASSGAQPPDGRVYEQVTPADKGGAYLATSPGEPVAVSANGNALLWDTIFTALPPLGSAPVAPNVVGTYLFSRAPNGGWSYTSALPADNLVIYRAAEGDQVEGVTPDLSTTVDATFFGLSDGHDGISGSPVQTGGSGAIQNFATFDPLSGAATVLTPSVPPSQTATYTPTFVATDSSADHILYQANASFPVTNGTVPNPGSNPGPFLYDDTAGSRFQVGLETDNSTPFPRGATAPPVPGVISADGSRIFFQAATSGASGVFMRTNDAAGSGATVPVSTSAVSDPHCTLASNPGAASTAPATFEGATPAGSVAFFLSSCELTSSSHTGTADNSPDLYAYDTANGHVTDLSIDTNGLDASSGADALGVVGYAGNGSIVYFVAEGVLDGSGAPSADNGLPNLYRYDGGTVTYLATLGSSDNAVWTPRTSMAADAGQYHAAQVSSDGRELVIAASAALTAYQSVGDVELYDWPGEADTPICVSCDPSGASPTGGAAMVVNSLSSNGNVIFSSPDELVGADGNTYPDVYEWTATPASPSAAAAADPYGGGSVSLVSAGATTISPTSTIPSTGSILIGASPSGTDAFFVTYDQLVAQDQDDSLDIYDARIGGIAPPPPPSQTLPACVRSLDGSCPTRSTAPDVTPPPIDPSGTNVSTRIGDNGAKATPPRVTIGATTRAQRTRDARRGRVTVPVIFSGAGAAHVVARASIAGRTRVVGTARSRATRAGTINVSFWLTSQAMSTLRRNGRLRLTVTVSVAAGATSRGILSLARSR